jgi:hypothetical protein
VGGYRCRLASLVLLPFWGARSTLKARRAKPAPPPTFLSKVRVVEVDVVVTNRQDEPVFGLHQGLHQKDFQVFENGKLPSRRAIHRVKCSRSVDRYPGKIDGERNSDSLKILPSDSGRRVRAAESAFAVAVRTATAHPPSGRDRMTRPISPSGTHTAPPGGAPRSACPGAPAASPQRACRPLPPPGSPLGPALSRP